MLTAGHILQNRYNILEVVGRGGMGTVYRATHAILQRDVAIKEMVVPDAVQRVQAVRLFHKEARVLAALDHPGLVRVTDCFEEGGSLYLVMDFIAGETLEQRAARPVEAAVVLDWMLQVCDVLAYLHGQEHPIIVRDVKPGNIMLDARGKIRLVDFGIARVLVPKPSTSTLIAVTPGFAPVEQYGGGECDARTDLYALGATLYVLLTGTVPPPSVALLALDARLRPPSELNAAVTPALEAVILKLMAMHKADRFGSASEARAAIAAALHSMEDPPAASASAPSVLPRTVPAPPEVLAKGIVASRQPRPHRYRRSIATLLILLLAGAAAVAPLRVPAPTATIALRSKPSGARILLDGRVEGNTPKVLDGVSAGGHRLRLELAGYEPLEQDLKLTSATTASLNLALVSLPGQLVLTVEPPGSDLLIDGRKVAFRLAGQTTVAVPAGSHAIELRKRYYLPYRKAIQVAWDRPVKVRARLEPADGTLVVDVNTDGATVKLDGRAAGSGSEVRLPHLAPRTWQIRVEKAGYEAYEQSVSVARGKIATVRVSLRTYAEAEAQAKRLEEEFMARLQFPIHGYEGEKLEHVLARVFPGGRFKIDYEGAGGFFFTVIVTMPHLTTRSVHGSFAPIRDDENRPNSDRARQVLLDSYV